MKEELRKRRSWLDGFMAYPAPTGLSQSQLRENIILLDQALYALWNLGHNLIFAWTPEAKGLRVLVAPHPMLTEYALGDGNLPRDELTRRARLLDKMLSNQEHLDTAAFDEVCAALGVEPRLIELPFSPQKALGLPLIAAVATRYGVRLVEDRAVILFDAVGFSLLTPLQQVVQLNSLSCSVNAAYAKLLDREININFARTTTGDGFYIWNRMRGVEANVELYQLMQFILADNALAHERATRAESVPRLRACFHVGSHYEFYQSEGLNPTSFSYLVGQVTIELARMIENAQPGQILVGKFNTMMHDEATGGDVRIDSLDFVERTRAPLRSLNGLKLAGSEVDEIACYLTGRRDSTGLWGISEYQIADKHGLIHRVYNAKINIHRRNGEPIYLGLREEDLPPDAPRRVADTEMQPLQA
ncbi:MAG: hypothetical protein EOP39_05955 [Rubrivivax sp.]|nr:MAG: hypothetical protein EOP39_05955 [Rubrivivax sp.]